jgi:hypothetical protein
VNINVKKWGNFFNADLFPGGGAVEENSFYAFGRVRVILDEVRAPRGPGKGLAG